MLTVIDLIDVVELILNWMFIALVCIVSMSVLSFVVVLYVYHAQHFRPPVYANADDQDLAWRLRCHGLRQRLGLREFLGL